MMSNEKNVLSLFNGMSFCMMALETLNVPVGNYYSSEIDKYANQATQAMFPDAIQLGDVTKWREWDIDWSSIDLVTGGFPCQAWSMAGKQLGDKDERGMLFWTMLDIMKHVKYHNPEADFLIENVKMKKEFEEYITTHIQKELNVVYFEYEDIMPTGEMEYVQEECGKGLMFKTLINSALVSAQNRNRYYWTSFEVEQPKDKGIMLKDIIEHDVNGEYDLSDKANERANENPRSRAFKAGQEKSGAILANQSKQSTDALFAIVEAECYVKCVNDNERVKHITENDRGYRPNQGDIRKSGISEMGRILKDGAEKTDTVTTSHMPKLAVNNDINNLKYRKLTPRECFRLQTVPEHHIDTLLGAGISNTQLYKMCGNGFTMEVIVHILKNLQR